jgi:hypothetical protein
MNQLVVLALRFGMKSVLRRAHEQQQALEQLLTHENSVVVSMAGKMISLLDII